MPKQKTHSGLKKRIKVTGSGKLKRGQAYTGHLKQNKTTKQNKQLSKSTLVHSSDIKRIKSLISNML
ncbi:MAG: 50S ribosomal protein L35 [bacterium]